MVLARIEPFHVLLSTVLHIFHLVEVLVDIGNEESAAMFKFRCDSLKPFFKLYRRIYRENHENQPPQRILKHFERVKKLVTEGTEYLEVYSYVHWLFRWLIAPEFRERMEIINQKIDVELRALSTIAATENLVNQITLQHEKKEEDEIELPSPEASLEALLTLSIQDQYAQGRKLISNRHLFLAYELFRHLSESEGNTEEEQDIIYNANNLLGELILRYHKLFEVPLEEAQRPLEVAASVGHTFAKNHLNQFFSSTENGTQLESKEMDDYASLNV